VLIGEIGEGLSYSEEFYMVLLDLNIPLHSSLIEPGRMGDDREDLGRDCHIVSYHNCFYQMVCWYAAIYSCRFIIEHRRMSDNKGNLMRNCQMVEDKIW
jgi:hypothetical protein